LLDRSKGWRDGGMRGGGVKEREREKERGRMCDIGAGIVCMYRMDEEWGAAGMQQQ
jgi:hypothetical protein